jgi:hypothetical protein
MKAFVVLSLFVGIGSAAIAQDDETKCCCTTYDMSVCLSKVNDKVDAELNTTYQKAMSLTKRFGSQDVETSRMQSESGRRTEMRPAKLSMAFGEEEVEDPMHKPCA